MKRATAIISLLLSLTFTWITSRAEVANDSVSLSTVEVVAQRPFAKVIPAQELEGRRLEGLNSLSVADAMRYFSGIQIKDYGGVGGIKTIDMRSMGSNHAGVFYDGIQLGNAQNGQIDLGKFSLDNIEKISLYNGQRSEILQSAKDFGWAGTVYIESRRPRFNDNEHYHVNATFRTGSFGLVNPSARLDLRLNDNLNATISAEYTYATGKYHFRYRKVFEDGTVAWDTTATRHNGDIHALRVEGGLYGTMHRGSYQAKLYYYDSERGIPGAIVNNVWKNAQRQWDRNFFAQGRVRKSFSSRYTIQGNVKYARDYMRYLNPDTTLMYVNNRFTQHEIYASVAQRLTIIDGWDAALSVDYQWNSLDASLADFARPRRHTLLAALATAVSIGPLKAQASVLGTAVNDRAGNDKGRATRRLSRLTPAVFLSWQPWKEHDLTLRAFYKRIFRMPTFNELYYTDIGNATLNPENADQFNVGLTWHRDFNSTIWNSIDFTVDGYYNEVTDKIIAVPKGSGQYRWMMMNIGRVHIKGVDITASLETSLAPDLFIGGRLNYTFQRAQDYTDPSDSFDEAGSYKGQIAYIPRHSGAATLNARWRRLQGDYSFIYVGERYHNSSNIPANYEQPWYTHDMSLSYPFTLDRCTLRVTAEVNNIFNQQYEVIRNYPMPGRNYRIILKFDI